MNIAHLFEENIRKHGEYDVIFFQGRWYKNTAICEEIRKLASALAAGGFRKGDKAVVMLPNCPELIISYGAISVCGGVISPVLFLLQPEEIRHILVNSEACTLISDIDFMPKITEAIAGVDTVKRVILVGEGEIPSGFESFGRLIAEGKDDFGTVEMSDDDLAAIFYTSGTTGKPKGVMITHANIYAAARGSTTARRFDPYETGLMGLPVSHAFGMILVMTSQIVGARGILLKWFDPEIAMQEIERHRVVIVPGVPTMFVMMLEHPNADKYDLSSVKHWITAAAPMPEETRAAFLKKFGGVMLDGYGLTEAAPVVTLTRDGMPFKKGSVGTVIPDVTVKIAGEDGRELPAGETGEILVKGPNVMKGYFKMPEETAKTLSGGWLHTGDMGRLDQDSYLFISDRKRDLIIRGGFNVYPKDIEDALLTHPAVLEAAAVGVPDHIMGEEVMAFIVLRPDAAATEEEMKEYCISKLAKFKTPRYISFVSYLPRNAIGKIVKKELREEGKRLLESVNK